MLFAQKVDGGITIIIRGVFQTEISIKTNYYRYQLMR